MIKFYELLLLFHLRALPDVKYVDRVRYKSSQKYSHVYYYLIYLTTESSIYHIHKS